MQNQYIYDEVEIISSPTIVQTTTTNVAPVVVANTATVNVQEVPLITNAVDPQHKTTEFVTHETYTNTSSQLVQSSSLGSMHSEEEEDTIELPLERANSEDDTNELVVVSSAGHKHVWGMSGIGDLYHCRMGEVGLEWLKLRGGIKFGDFSVAQKGYLFAIEKATGHLYRFDPDHKKIELACPKERKTLKSVSAVNWDLAYCLDLEGNLFMFEKDKFVPLPGVLKKVSAGGSISTGVFGLKQKHEVWGIDAQDNCVRYKQEANQWETFNIKLQDVTCGKDGSVYGIRLMDFQLVKFDREAGGFFYQTPKNHNKTALSEVKLKNVTAYKENRDIYAVTHDGNIIRLDGH
ncbi:tectonin-1 [Acrasis kona]|uniref:Tectonin-1 n=1 Tax=Acrasis kona TaxID=1008807 RepID=A0AAW2YSF7_9EUKA